MGIVRSSLRADILSLRCRFVRPRRQQSFMTRPVLGAVLLAACLASASGCGGRRVAPAVTAAPPAAPAITDGPSLVRAMRQKYGGQWFRTLSFTQNNTLYSARGGETNSQWRERISV